MTSRTSTRLLVRLAVSVGLVLATFLIANSVTATPSRRSGPHGPATNAVDKASVDMTRSVVTGRVNWAVSRRDSADGPCIGVVASVDGVDEGSVGGGCGPLDDQQSEWGIGGLEVSGQWYNLAYGQAPAAASSVQVTTGDGKVWEDNKVLAGGGLWIVVVPGDPLSLANDIERISVLDASGAVITDVKPPSLVAYRRQAENTPAGSEG